MALPYGDSDWAGNLKEALDCYAAMVRAFLYHDADIQILLLTVPGIELDAWLRQLELSPSALSRLTIITTIPYNDTWVRDYGPLSLRESDDSGRVSYCAFQFNGWGNKYASDQDNAVVCALEPVNVPIKNHFDWVLEGGALEVNGQGVLLANQKCILDKARNPGFDLRLLEEKLLASLGLEKIVWLKDIQLSGDDTDGHIDTLARFIEDDCVICCGQNPMHSDAQALAFLVEQMTAICQENHWTLHTLPVPTVYSRLDGRLLPATYANFLHCNRHVFLPVYGVEEDEQALSTLQKLLPKKTIVPIRCEALLEQHGSLHCATMQLA